MSDLTKERCGKAQGCPDANPAKDTFRVVFRVAWLALLVGTPFFIEAHNMPSVFSSAYAFIAVGLIAGVLISRFVGSYAPRALLVPTKLTLLVLGIVVTVCLVLPEWYFHLRAFAGSALPMERIAPYVPLMVAFADIPSAPFGNLALLHHFLFFAAGLCCSYCLSTGDEAEKSCLAVEKPTNDRRGILLIVGIFACGFLHIGTWGWLAHVYGSNWSDAVNHDLLGFMGSTIFAIVASLLLAYLVCVGSRKLGASFRLVLFSFAAGELAWNLLSRCGDAISSILLFAPAASVLLFVVELLLFCLVRFSGGESSGDDGDIVAGETGPEKGIGQLLDDASLTDRERQAVELAARGKNSAESAELIGVKASTVRTYLHRAYQKLGVSGLEELLAAGVGKDSRGIDEEEAVTGADCSGTLSGVAEMASFLSVPLLLLLFGLFVLPHQYVGTVLSWGSSHSVVIGCGLGLMMSGGLLALLRRFRVLFCGGLWTSVLFAALLAVGGFAFVGLQFLFAHGLLSLAKGAQLFFLGLSSLVFSFCLGLYAWKVLGLSRTKTISNSFSFRAVCLVALALVLLSYVSDYAWFALCLFVLVTAFFFAVNTGYVEKSQIKVTADGSLVTLQDGLLCVGALLPFGVITGELWRGLQNPLLLGIYVVFLGVVCVVIPKRKVRELFSGVLWPAFFAFALASIAVVAGVPHALLLLVFVITLVELSSGWKRFVPFELCGLGLGLSFGRLGFDAWRDYLGAYFTTTESFGVNVATAALGPAFMVVVAVLGLACLLYLVSLYRTPEALMADSTKEERDVLLLRGKGINELEALVLVKIAEGMTGPQIARSLNYSLGAINSLRAHGYRVLDVHSKQELKALLDSMR